MAAPERILWIEPDAPPKPVPGAPCNGCGVCCLLEPCPVGWLLSRRRRGPCAALRWVPAERRYRCGALVATGTVFGWGQGRLGRALSTLARPLLARWIAAGVGCDCDAQVVASPKP